MPRKREPALFTLGEYWIRADEAGRPGFRRYWYDRVSGRVRRARLASTDLEEAKLELAKLILTGAPQTLESYLAVVLSNYKTGVTDRLPSKKPAERAVELVTRFMTGPQGHKVPRVAHFDAEAQKKFAAWCANTFKHSVKTISRNLSVVNAALEHAKIADLEIRYTVEAITAMLNEEQATVIEPKRRFHPNDAELARFLDGAGDGRLFRACIIMLMTACRPEAALDLGPKQRNREAGVLQLNPEGRRQRARKWRPIVREPAALTAWLDLWEEEARKARVTLTSYVGYASVDSLQSAITRVRVEKAVKLPEMVAYSLRHKATTIMRRYEVPSDQINVQLGHRKPSNRTSDLYGEYEPGYLAKAAAAFDAYLIRLQTMTTRRLFAGTAPAAANVETLKDQQR